MKRYSIDRFESGIAVCIDDDGGELLLPRDKLPEDVSAGSVIAVNDEGEAVRDTDAEEERRAEIRKLRRSIWGDGE